MSYFLLLSAANVSNAAETDERQFITRRERIDKWEQRDGAFHLQGVIKNDLHFFALLVVEELASSSSTVAVFWASHW